MEMLGTIRRAKSTSYGPNLNRAVPYLCLFNIPHLLMSIIFSDIHKSSHETWLQFRKFHVNRTGETAKSCHMPYFTKHVVSSFLNKMHVLFLTYDRNTGSCLCLSLHLLMYFIIISHKNHCTGMSSQITECGCAVILSNGFVITNTKRNS